MANTALIDGTAYEVAGGKTLVDGTSYSVSNGKALVDGTAYDISFLLPPAVLDLWSDSSYAKIQCITYADGYWVVGGMYHDGSTHYARIMYSKSLDGDWATNDLWVGNGNSSDGIICITHADGYWVVGGAHLNSSATDPHRARISYATSLDGTWTSKDLWSNGQPNQEIRCIVYADGYWVVGGSYYDYGDTYKYHARIAYATSLSGSWTQKDIWKGDYGYNSISCMTYAGGYWVVGGEYIDDNADTHAGRIAYATAPGGSWSIKDVGTATNGMSNVHDITYGGGYWVICGSGRVAYATALSGSWNVIYPMGKPSGSQKPAIYGIAYHNGCWVAVGQWETYWQTTSERHARIAYTTDLSAEWTVKDIWTGIMSSTTALCVVNINGYWVVGGTLVDTDKVRHAYLTYAGNPEELGNTE
jgi:hypothetical protein